MGGVTVCSLDLLETSDDDSGRKERVIARMWLRAGSAGETFMMHNARMMPIVVGKRAGGNQ
jgi:hypothetical protein